MKILVQRPTHISAVATVLERDRERERERERECVEVCAYATIYTVHKYKR